MKMSEWKTKHWVLMILIWYIVTFGCFFLSEKFNDTDAVMYPAVFIMILFLLIGPGMVGAMCPFPKTAAGAQLRQWVPLVCYVVGWVSMRILALICFRLHIL